MNDNLGNEILNRRKEKGLTQADVAARFGVSIQAVSKWERGLSKPSEEIINELVEFLGLTVECAPKTKKTALITRFIRFVLSDFLRIVCVGVIMAAAVCFIFGFISLDSAFSAACLSTAVFLFATISRQT